MNNEQKERLAELITQSIDGCARNWAETIVDYLLENNVMAFKEAEKTLGKSGGMSRYIDKDLLIQRATTLSSNTKEGYLFYNSIYNMITNMPEADVTEVKHAKWDRSGYCSNCDFWTCYCDYNYCPNCGARMEEGE